MGTMVKGFWVSHKNSLGCELDQVFIKALEDEELTQMELKRALISMISGNELYGGDLFRVEDGESEY